MGPSVKRVLAALLFIWPAAVSAQAHHERPGPEKLGTVAFPTSCAPSTRAGFDRAAALLHSFAYDAAETAFRAVSVQDPHCAMAWWGMAMTHYHQLWEPASDEAGLRLGEEQIRRAESIGTAAPREQGFIDALAQYFEGGGGLAERAGRYAAAMGKLAGAWPRDDEVQIFYALALLATAQPSDRTHANQLRAADILEPIWRRRPHHPGVPHYLIHAYDSAELAPRGLAAARAYARIAPSAPHALHMPSHIFTRLGLWDDSIAANLAARAAARTAGDLGEELHAMDYLTYAYLQRGRLEAAKGVVNQMRAMSDIRVDSFKSGYAANAMPVRLVVESADWAAAARLTPLPGSPPAVQAIVYWARALGHSRGPVPDASDADIASLENCVQALRATGAAYWVSQTEIMLQEARAWRSAALGDSASAQAGLRAAADAEDSFEKLPVTPGPIVPAREQLGELLLSENHPDQAEVEFNAALKQAPGRRGALRGVLAAAERLGDVRTADRMRRALD